MKVVAILKSRVFQKCGMKMELQVKMATKNALNVGFQKTKKKTCASSQSQPRISRIDTDF